jgi:hypothetical protein
MTRLTHMDARKLSLLLTHLPTSSLHDTDCLVVLSSSSRTSGLIRRFLISQTGPSTVEISKRMPIHRSSTPSCNGSTSRSAGSRSCSMPSLETTSGRHHHLPTSIAWRQDKSRTTSNCFSQVAKLVRMKAITDCLQSDCVLSRQGHWRHHTVPCPGDEDQTASATNR